MSLPGNNNKKGKQGNKNQKNAKANVSYNSIWLKTSRER